MLRFKHNCAKVTYACSHPTLVATRFVPINFSFDKLFSSSIVDGDAALECSSKQLSLVHYLNSFLSWCSVNIEHKCNSFALSSRLVLYHSHSKIRGGSEGEGGGVDVTYVYTFIVPILEQALM